MLHCRIPPATRPARCRRNTLCRKLPRRSRTKRWSQPIPTSWTSTTSPSPLFSGKPPSLLLFFSSALVSLWWRFLLKSEGPMAVRAAWKFSACRSLLPCGGKCYFLAGSAVSCIIPQSADWQRGPRLLQWQRFGPIELPGCLWRQERAFPTSVYHQADMPTEWQAWSEQWTLCWELPGTGPIRFSIILRYDSVTGFLWYEAIISDRNFIFVNWGGY